MDIDLLSKMVKELILDNDKVVLPGLGCFVAEIVPAYFSDKGYTINPPYRKLYFRARPDEGELLVEFYAKSNSLAREVAEKIIKDFVAELRTVLHAKKVVVFPGLGRLRATKENNIFFIADEDLDIYPEGLGLGPISLKTHKETAEEVSAAVFGLKSILEPIELEPIAESTAEPEIELIAEPVPEIEPAPEAESEPELEFFVEPMPESEPVPEPKPTSESTPEPEPEQASDPESEQPLVSEPESELEVGSEPESEQAPVSDPVIGAEILTEIKSSSDRKAVKVLLVILAVIALLVLAYMAVGRLCPEWIDQFLYTPEELDIINR